MCFASEEQLHTSHICVQDYEKGYFRSSCNIEERVKVCQHQEGVLSHVFIYTPVGKTTDTVLPT